MDKVLPAVSLYSEMVKASVPVSYLEGDEKSCEMEVLPRVVAMARPIIELLGVMYHAIAALIKIFISLATFNQLQHCSCEGMGEYTFGGASSHLKCAVDAFVNVFVGLKSSWQGCCAPVNEIFEDVYGHRGIHRNQGRLQESVTTERRSPTTIDRTQTLVEPTGTDAQASQPVASGGQSGVVSAPVQTTEREQSELQTDNGSTLIESTETVVPTSQGDVSREQSDTASIPGQTVEKGQNVLQEESGSDLLKSTGSDAQLSQPVVSGDQCGVLSVQEPVNGQGQSGLQADSAISSALVRPSGTDSQPSKLTIPEEKSSVVSVQEPVNGQGQSGLQADSAISSALARSSGTYPQPVQSVVSGDQSGVAGVQESTVNQGKNDLQLVEDPLDDSQSGGTGGPTRPVSYGTMIVHSDDSRDYPSGTVVVHSDDRDHYSSGTMITRSSAPAGVENSMLDQTQNIDRQSEFTQDPSWEDLLMGIGREGQTVDKDELIQTLRQIGRQGELLDKIEEDSTVKKLAGDNARMARTFIEKIVKNYQELGLTSEDFLEVSRTTLEMFCLTCEKRKAIQVKFQSDVLLISTVFMRLEGALSDDSSCEMLLEAALLKRLYIADTLENNITGKFAKILTTQLAANPEFVIDHEKELALFISHPGIRQCLACAFYQRALEHQDDSNELRSCAMKVAIYSDVKSTIRANMRGLLEQKRISLRDSGNAVPVANLRVSTIIERLDGDAKDERVLLKDKYFAILEKIRRGDFDSLREFETMDGFYNLLVSLSREDEPTHANEPIDINTGWKANMLLELSEDIDQLLSHYPQESVLEFCEKVKTLYVLNVNFEDEPNDDPRVFTLENSLLTLYSKAAEHRDL